VTIYDLFLVAYAAALVAGAWWLDRLARQGHIDW
jgi:hypothetical protein